MTWKQRGLGIQGEGFLWPIYLFVVVYLGPERWLHTDSAYTLFRILNHQNLFYDRFACELLVWPGQLLSYLGAPLPWVLQSLNLILPLMAWLAWCLAYKSPLRWLYFLVIFCGGSEAFFIGYSEIGLCTLAMITAIQCIVLDVKKLPLLLFFTIVAMWLSHPAGVLYLPILLVFLWPKLRSMEFFYLGLSLLGLFFIKQQIAPSNPYDSQLYQTLFHLLNFSQFLNLFSVNYIINAPWFFIPAATALACFIVGCMKPWRRWTSIYFFIFLINTIAAVLIYSQGDAHIHMEKFFYPVAVTGMMSIAIYQWKEIQAMATPDSPQKTKKSSLTQWISVPLWFMSFSMMLGIQEHLPTYRHRKQLLFELTTAQNATKCIVLQPAPTASVGPNEKMVKMVDSLSQLGSLWGLSYETAIASTWLGLENTRTTKIMTPEEFLQWSSINQSITDSLFIGAPFEQPQPIQQLNRRYFRFPINQNYTNL